VTGTVTILHHSGRYAVKVHNINLGLRVRVSHRFGSFDGIYDTPDAVELARRLNPTVLEGTTIVPTTINLTYKEPPPNSARRRRRRIWRRVSMVVVVMVVNDFHWILCKILQL
jgi:hypothetical protein